MNHSRFRCLGNTGGNFFTETETGIPDLFRIEQNQRGCRRNVVKECLKAGMEERLEEIDPLEIDGIVQIFENQAATVGRNIKIITAFFQAWRNIRQHLFRQQQLPGREQHQLFNRLEGALRQRIKGTHGLSRIAKEFNSNRCRQVGWEYIENSSPHGKSAAILHQRDIGVAYPDQSSQQVITVKLFAGKQVTGSIVECLPGEHPLQC